MQKLRKDLDRVNLEYAQLEAQIKERQSAGIPPSEDDYQKLLKLYNQRQTLEKQIDAADERDEEQAAPKSRLLRQEVTEDEIAEVVSAWTGIPVSRMLETEKAKLLVMEERLHQRVVGQDEAVAAVSARRPPQPQRPARPATARSARSCSSAPPASAKPSCARPWPRSCSTTSTPWSAST